MRALLNAGTRWIFFGTSAPMEHRRRSRHPPPCGEGSREGVFTRTGFAEPHPHPARWTDLASQVLSRFPPHKGEGGPGGCDTIESKNPFHQSHSRLPPLVGRDQGWGYSRAPGLQNHTTTLLHHGLGKPSPISLPGHSPTAFVALHTQRYQDKKGRRHSADLVCGQWMLSLRLKAQRLGLLDAFQRGDFGQLRLGQLSIDRHQRDGI